MPKYIEDFISLALQYAPKFILALLVLVVGMWAVNNFSRMLGKLMSKRSVDPTVSNFLLSLVNVGLKVLVLLSVASMVGIQTTSFVAVLGAAGLAIGLALQGSLGNFASGTLLLIFRPYKVGDLVQIQGFVGKVSEIQIFNTVILTPDNRKVILPNSTVTSGAIVNISGQGLIRVDMEFGIAYTASIDKARTVIQAVADANDKVLTNPPIDIFVHSHGQNAVKLAVRPWVHPDDYWAVYFYFNEALKHAFDREGIEIPFQTMNVNLSK